MPTPRPARPPGPARLARPARPGGPVARPARPGRPVARPSCQLGCLGDRPQQLGLELGSAVGGEQAVLLLLDIGQLRVAEALDRAGFHQRVDQAAVRLEELRPVAYLEPPPAARPRDAQAAE